MKRYGRTINLKDDPETIRRYVEYHENVWPEVERGLREIGIESMLIWRLGRRLFMYIETEDGFQPERDFARYMESDSRIREWESIMRTLQEPVPEAPPGEWWVDMEPIYSLSALE